MCSVCVNHTFCVVFETFVKKKEPHHVGVALLCLRVVGCVPRSVIYLTITCTNCQDFRGNNSLVVFQVPPPPLGGTGGGRFDKF